MNSQSQRTVAIFSFLKLSEFNKNFRVTAKTLAFILSFRKYFLLRCSAFSDGQQKSQIYIFNLEHCLFRLADSIVQWEPKGARI